MRVLNSSVSTHHFLSDSPLVLGAGGCIVGLGPGPYASDPPDPHATIRKPSATHTSRIPILRIEAPFCSGTINASASGSAFRCLLTSKRNHRDNLFEDMIHSLLVEMLLIPSM